MRPVANRCVSARVRPIAIHGRVDQQSGEGRAALSAAFSNKVP
jgi:hypothetical protein